MTRHRLCGTDDRQEIPDLLESIVFYVDQLKASITRAWVDGTHSVRAVDVAQMADLDTQLIHVCSNDHVTLSQRRE